MGTKYRYKNGEVISAWLLADGLREAVRTKHLKPESLIQQAGRDDWLPARTVAGLFPPEPAPEPVAAPKEDEGTRVEARPGQRPAETIHHLLHRSVRCAIHLRTHDGGQHQKHIVQGLLLGVTADGFMAELPEAPSIIYVPLARVRAVAISTRFPAQGPPRKGEALLIDIDSLPDLSEVPVPAGAA